MPLSPSVRVRQAAVDAILGLDLEPLLAAATDLSERVRAGGLAYVLGAGHSQLLTLEAYYRAGGPAWIVPILDERLSPARGSALTEVERRSGIGPELVAGLGRGHCLIVISNSGRNAVPVEAAQAASAAGLLTMAITSRSSGNRLAQVVDHVLDTRVPPGDATVEVGRRKMAPMSTVVGAVLLHALLAETEAIVEGGEILVSSNVEGGDRHNLELIRRHPHLQP